MGNSTDFGKVPAKTDTLRKLLERRAQPKRKVPETKVESEQDRQKQFIIMNVCYIK